MSETFSLLRRRGLSFGIPTMKNDKNTRGQKNYWNKIQMKLKYGDIVIKSKLYTGDKLLQIYKMNALINKLFVDRIQKFKEIGQFRCAYQKSELAKDLST